MTLCGALASAEPANALALLNAYLAQAAITDPNYRTELQIGAATQPLPPNRHAGRGPIVGAFTFRAKTYAELSRDERAALLCDPKFQAYLRALRAEADRGPNEVADPARETALPPRSKPRPSLQEFTLSADEMLQRRPLFIVLASP